MTNASVIAPPNLARIATLASGSAAIALTLWTFMSAMLILG